MIVSGVKYTIRDLPKGPGVAKAARLALDAGLKEHRRRFLPIHFTFRALQRYVKEYRVAAGKQKRGQAFRQKLAGMSVQQRAEFFQPRTAKRRFNAWYFGLTPAQRDAYRNMSQSERLRIAREVEGRRMQARERKERNSGADPHGNIPLVEEGRLRNAILNGSVSFSGPVAMRTMSLSSAPWYVTTNRPGQIHKVEAIQATVSEEETEFAKIVDKILDAHFKQA